jgi:hypothetical protein
MNEPKLFEAKGPIKWYLKLLNNWAITLPPFGIFILLDHINDKNIYNHEMIHWKQAQELGVVMFYIKYLFFQVRYGYWNNPMEVEARKAEK